MFGTSYIGFGSDPTYTQKIMKIPDIAWPTFFDSYRESMLISILMTNLFYSQVEGVPGSRTIIFFLFVFFLFVFLLIIQY